MAIVAITECVTFSRGEYDTHAAFDKKTAKYVFVISEKYIVWTDKGIVELSEKAGDSIKNPIRVLGERCPGFFELERKIKKGEVR